MFQSVLDCWTSVGHLPKQVSSGSRRSTRESILDALYQKQDSSTQVDRYWSNFEKQFNS